MAKELIEAIPNKKAKILIIEDNFASRKVLRINLEAENYIVLEAEDGASALNEAKKQNFDLVIQDLVLPDMDGYLLNTELRKLPGYDKIPIFALSGFLHQADIKTKASGFTILLLKPIEPSYLIEFIKAHLPAEKPTNMNVGKGKHILIADDNPIQLKLFAIQLKDYGFKVSTALDGAIALEEAKQNPPDAIISDILMPNMDGYSLCLEIKREPKLTHIPVMLLTSHYVETEDLELAKKVGASGYLTRTPDVGKLIAELDKILKTKILVEKDAKFILTDEIKEKHSIRTIRQLEQQVLDNARLTQRCAMLMSELTLIGGIANTLTATSKNIDDSLLEVLHFFLDATSISKGILYLFNSDKALVFSQQVGYSEDKKSDVASLFGAADLIQKLIEKDKLILIPSAEFPENDAKNFLAKATVKSAALIPIFSGEKCLGLLFLDAQYINFSDENISKFILTLGVQFGQSIALASTFDRLGSSEKRYRQLVEISPDAIFVVQNERLVYANSAALKLLSANHFQELLFHSFYNFFTQEYQEVFEKNIGKNRKEDSTLLYDGKITNLKGDILDVEMVVSPVLHENKPAEYMIMRDITERKRSVLHLELQYAIAWILAESATLYEATAKILKIIGERLEWDCGAIWAVDPKANVMRCTRVWQNALFDNDSFQKENFGFTCLPGEGLLGQVWTNRKAMWKSDILHEDNMIRKKAVTEIDLNSAVFFPIMYENEVMGVIEFFSKKKQNPDSHTLLWFESIGNQLGVFIKRKHMEKQMLYLAEHDVLTGLANRSLLEQYLNTALVTAKKINQALAILFLDLDHFKFINDSMGHEAGDVLLKEISERFRRCLRPQDTISRIGGDEFVIIIPEVQEKKDIIEIIERLQGQLLNKVLLSGKEFFITASIGVSLYPEDATTVQTLIKGADIAMYFAKEKGRNNFQFCTPEMTTKAEGQSILQNNLRQALENNEFILHYQPKISIASKKVVGMEALIRWKKPDGILLPGSFIAAAESSELIIPIGEWVLKTACMQNKAWQTAGLPAITMSINLSIKNLNPFLLDLMERTLAETKLDPETFEIELTESTLMANVENNIQILHSLKKLGLKISIDDFGTGYSSLSYLKRFPIDTIKIDQSFVRDLATDPDDAAIVTAIIAMSKSLNFKTIAEGVETEEQFKFLCEHGCDEIQGYYFSKPLPVDEATNFIQSAKIDWHFDNKLKPSSNDEHGYDTAKTHKPKQGS